MAELTVGFELAHMARHADVLTAQLVVASSVWAMPEVQAGVDSRLRSLLEHAAAEDGLTPRWETMSTVRVERVWMLDQDGPPTVTTVRPRGGGESRLLAAKRTVRTTPRRNT